VDNFLEVNANAANIRAFSVRDEDDVDSQW